MQSGKNRSLNVYRSCLSLCLMLLAFFASPTRASAAGLVSSNQNSYFVWGSGFGGYVNAATPSEACDAYAKNPQVTGPVVSQTGDSWRWQCTYTYRCDVGLPLSYCGTQYIMYADYVSPLCPQHSTGTSICTCDTGYIPDPTGTQCIPDCVAPTVWDAVTGQCTAPPASTTPAICKPYELKPFPPAGDACSAALEKFNVTQTEIDNACGTLNTNITTGIACLTVKLGALSPPIPFSQSSGVRSPAYQAHLREVWDKLEQLVDDTEKNPALKTECAAVRAILANEKGCDSAGDCKDQGVPYYTTSATQRSHKIARQPGQITASSQSLAQHTLHNAVDTNRDATIKPLLARLNKSGQTMQQFLDTPTAAYPNGCGLLWGGDFKTGSPDFVHFYGK